MAKILWIGDAGTTTGFGKVHAELAGRLARNHGHEIHSLAVMWDAKRPDTSGLNLYRAEAGPANHFLGFDRVTELLALVEPDVVILNEDVPQAIKRLTDNRYDKEMQLLNRQPVIAYVPVDGYNLPPRWRDLRLAQTVKTIAYTEFGRDSLGVDDFVPHAVDTTKWHPATEDDPIILPDGRTLTSKEECRDEFGIDHDAFVIGRVDTNTGRKDWGSTWKATNIAYLRGLPTETTLSLWHTKLNVPSQGVDLGAIIAKGNGKYMVTNANDWPEASVVTLMNCMNVFLTTSRGEGWGFTPAEAMACAVPVIATDGSALTEIVGRGGWLFESKAEMTNPYGVDLLLADVEAMADQLIWCEAHRGQTALRGGQAMLDIREKYSSWDESARRFNVYVEGLVS